MIVCTERTASSIILIIVQNDVQWAWDETYTPCSAAAGWNPQESETLLYRRTRPCPISWVSKEKTLTGQTGMTGRRTALKMRLQKQGGNLCYNRSWVFQCFGGDSHKLVCLHSFDCTHQLYAKHYPLYGHWWTTESGVRYLDGLGRRDPRTHWGLLHLLNHIQWLYRDFVIMQILVHTYRNMEMGQRFGTRPDKTGSCPQFALKELHVITWQVSVRWTSEKINTNKIKCIQHQPAETLTVFVNVCR